MIGPCPSCKSRHGCVARAVTEREALFAFAYGKPMGCEDYVEDSYHGVAGVVDVISLDRAGRSSSSVRGGLLVCRPYSPRFQSHVQ